ncbi:Oxysterol-binding protein-related protein 1 [Eumeta japonica]|uniref:Oxysterol-binding protein n=1 Tax=Eumeta variegata TaxID=151549 RepID=A0A4C1VJW7_EUMVA|nr:Oxysterol-binding protein-related protein 1 [Eumeta japonica]
MLWIQDNERNAPSLNPDRGDVLNDGTSLPVAQFSRGDFSLWSVLKNCVGKELSKITMPVVFNEPLSFLQRMLEYLEYAHLLRLAAEQTDPVARMEYIAVACWCAELKRGRKSTKDDSLESPIKAFAVSALASNWERLGKPFNPLLGETYELQRPEFRAVCEQVSHHPPVSAFHADSPHFVFHGSVHPKLKFCGKSVEIQPKGHVTVELPRWGEAYTWNNVNCCVHNVIVGKLWIEQYGAMEVVCHGGAGLRANLAFKPAGFNNRDLHRVDGFILDAEYVEYMDAVPACVRQMDELDIVRILKGGRRLTVLEWKGRVFHFYVCLSLLRRANHARVEGTQASLASFKKRLRFVYGKWTQCIKCCSIEDYERWCKERGEDAAGGSGAGAAGRPNGRNEQVSQPDETDSDDVPKPDESTNIDIPDSVLLWEARPRPSNSAQYYQFTEFAMSLNEMERSMESKLCPTDSRLRPDVRLLERGDVDGAAAEKTRLEEKQRTTRKILKKSSEGWQPRWFSQGTNPYTKQEDWLYNGGYWDRNYQHLKDVDIF